MRKSAIQPLLDHQRAIQNSCQCKHKVSRGTKKMYKKVKLNTQKSKYKLLIMSILSILVV